MRILISGVGIAGPTLAFWLRKDRHEVVLVEEAPRLRQGGYIIDFWGLGYDVAGKMNLIPRIREQGYLIREVRFVNRHGRRTGGFPVDLFRRWTQDRFTSLRRSDVAAILYDSLEGRVETIFGDSVAAVEHEGGCMRVGFEHTAPREFDLVIGADGLHSRIRRVAFGPEAEFEHSLDYHVAAFEVEGYRPREELVYITHSIPGRQVSRFSMRNDRTLFLFLFRDEYLPAGDLSTVTAQKSALTSVFAGMGWECPRILEAMKSVSGIYFDRISQIRMERWSVGGTALVGDAAACVSLMAGEGTGLAMAEAYVLAGELRASGGDLRSAFARYEARMMPLVKRKQASAERFASAFAPKSAFGIGFRDLVTRLLGVPFVADHFIGGALRDTFELPDYGF